MNRARFARRARLLTAGDYQYVFDRAERSSDACFTVLARFRGENRLDGEARLGLAISKKRVRLAVARNRLKRIIRESFRLNRALLPVADIIVLAGPKCSTASNARLFNSLDNHWKKLKERCAKS